MPRQSREDLREKLIEIAERTIAQDGLGALRARALAQAAGCALGAIYNVFSDLDQLVLAVNGRTFLRLGQQVRSSVASEPLAHPARQLVLMAQGYRQFATANRSLWLALFDVRLRSDDDVPDWYWREMAALFEIISAPLATLFPQHSPEQRDLWVRTLFSAVHGIVLLGIEKRISGVPDDRVAEMLELLVLQTVQTHS